MSPDAANAEWEAERRELQAIVDGVLADVPDRGSFSWRDVYARGHSVGAALRGAGFSEKQIGLWLADCARAALRHENRAMQVLRALSEGIGYVLSVDRGHQRIELRRGRVH